LEKFCDDEEELMKQTFTDRSDLVRIDQCFHRFHLICVFREWFMDRKIETDEFGCKIVYPVPEQKRCPICRNEVSIEDLEDIRMKYGAQLEIVEDHNYD
jgi:hypothetical protein